MPFDPHEAAKRVLIAYRQLNEIIKEEHIGLVSAVTHVESYNRILDILNECFSIDKAFVASVSHLHHLQDGTKQLSYQMESDGRILRATAHSFIEMYLSPEDKKKLLGSIPRIGTSN